MTPEQVTKWKARSYVTLGAGIAALIMAYQYAVPATGRAEPPPEFAPYLFAGLGIVCFIAAGLMALKVSRQNVPAATTDLSGPQGKIVIGWLVAGCLALAGSYLVDYLMPQNDMLGLLISTGLLVVMIICFFTAARIGRKIRNASKTGAGQ